jgi:iron complex outermembrane receptor protein
MMKSTNRKLMNVPKTSHRYLSQSTPYLSALMLSTSLAYAHPAHADEEAPLATTQTPAPLATSPHTLLETVVVTSTRANTPKAKHPGNVAQIDGQEVIEIQADHIEQIVNRLPGVNVQRGNGQENLTAIRSPVLTGGAGAGSFLDLEDGVPMRAAGFANVNGLFDAVDDVVNSIEVIRGPGSALYGSNAVHGLMNFISLPSTITPEAITSVRVGPHGVLNSWGTASAGVDAPTYDHSVRLSFSAAKDDGFQDDTGFSQQKGQLRYDYTNQANVVVATINAMNLNQETGGYVNGTDAYKDDALRKTNANPEAYRDAWSLRSAVHWTHAFNDGSSLTLTPYARTNRMEFRMHFLPSQAIEKNGHWSVGLQSSYNLPLQGGHTLIIGNDFEYSDGYLSELQTDPDIFSYEQGLHYNYTVQATTIAPYLHATWALSDATKLTTGVRFEFTDYEYDNLTADGFFGTANRFYRAPDRSDQFADVTPKLGITHQFNPDFIGFANLSRGARAPQATDLYRMQLNQVAAEAKSEKLDSLEIGSRGRLGGVEFEVAAFYMKKKNYFFRDSNNYNVINGRTKHYGIELEAFRTLGEHFDISASATYAIHKYDFNRDVGDINSNITSGDDVDTAPRTLANVRIGYTPIDAARFELEWVHMGEYYTDPGNQEEYEGHDLFNLRASWDLNESLQLSGSLTNILDTRYAERADFNRGADRYFVGEDRALNAGITVRF